MLALYRTCEFSCLESVMSVTDRDVHVVQMQHVLSDVNCSV